MIGAAVHTLPFLQMYVSVEMNLCVPAYWWLMMREDVVQFHFAWQVLHFVHILEVRSKKAWQAQCLKSLPYFVAILLSSMLETWFCVVFEFCANMFSVFPVLLLCVATAELSLVSLWWHFSSSTDVVFSVGLLLWGDVSGDFFSGAFVVGVPFCNSRNATKKSLLEKSSRKRARRDVFTKRVQTKCSRIKKFVQEDLSKTPVQETFQNLGNRCQEMLV